MITLEDNVSTMSKLVNTNVSNPKGGEPVDITHKDVVHLLYLGGPFFLTRDDRREIWNGKKYKWFFVDSQAMTADGSYIVCRTRFERLIDANSFINELQDKEEVQLKNLHEIVAPIYLEQGKTPEEEEEERDHNIQKMCDEIREAPEGADMTELCNKWFNTKYIFINDEINRKYPRPKYREFLRVADEMENYGKFQREI